MRIECLSSVNKGVDQVLIEIWIEGCPRILINSRLWMPLMLTILEVKVNYLRLLSFGVIWIWISDPRSVWIMVKQRNRWIRSGGQDSPVPLMYHDPDRSWITDPDPDHSKGKQPYIAYNLTMATDLGLWVKIHLVNNLVGGKRMA